MPSFSKNQDCIVKLLDGEEFVIKLNVETSYGVELYDRVCESLDLTERDYFSLRFIHPKDKMYSWLNFRKTLKMQLKEGPYMFYFFVKYFPPDPCTLQEDLTRYLFVLALRDLIYFGRLNCSPHYHLLLCSFIVQAEFGDFSADLVNKNYLDGIKFIPNQKNNFCAELISYHKNHAGLTPEEVEIQYLKVVKDLPLYGVEMHDVKDSDYKDFILGISFKGLHIFNKDCELMKIYWQELIAASFFKKSLTIKITAPNKHTKNMTYKCCSRGATKRLYRSIVDFHTFFRRPLPLPPIAGVKLSSRFRYNGRRTYLQIKNSITSASSKFIYPESKTKLQNSQIPEQTPILIENYNGENNNSDDSDSSGEQHLHMGKSSFFEYEKQMLEIKFDEWGCRLPDSFKCEKSPQTKTNDYIEQTMFIPNKSYIV